VPNTNSTALPERDQTRNSPEQLSTRDSRILIEEIACAISEAQAALFAGRIQDFELSIIRQQGLCAELKELRDGKRPFGNSDQRELSAAAQRVRGQSLVFGAAVRRISRHLETLRSLLNGPSLTYEPKPVKLPGREG
jgi:hypothetical protein